MKKTIVYVCIFVLAWISVEPVRAVSADNYSITNYDVHMTLGRDSENRSTLKTIETITAQFPDYDQNHGLERVFVKEYNGHKTSLELVSVTDENGQALTYGWSGDALRIGSANTYVHGPKTYVITYTQRDVTRYYADTGKDEFYWDVIGFEWRVPVQQASVKIVLESGIANTFTKDAYCYYGVSGSEARCEISNLSSDQQPLAYSGATTNIGNGQGVTVALGFKKGTFAEYKASLAETLFSGWVALQAVIAVAGGVFVGWLVVRWNNLMNRKKEIGTIVPEYLPPKDVSVTVSAKVGGHSRSIMTAQLLDLAVRHYIKIYEVKEKTLFGAPEYEIEIIRDITELKWEEQELLKDTFGALPTTVGKRLNLKTLKNNTAYYSRTQNNDRDTDKLIRGKYALREKAEDFKRWLRHVALVLLIVGVLLLSPVLLLLTLLLFVGSFFTFRLTNKGLDLKRHLEGLKIYIKVAEEERIAMLQGPDGAEKVASVVNGVDSRRLIKLYEKVLPYAVLFGQEKKWNKQIGSYYEANSTKPDWYSSNNAVFSAVAFSSAMNSFSSASKNASSASSSSGGSGGGGSAGGGGGGGGGGGW